MGGNCAEIGFNCPKKLVFHRKTVGQGKSQVDPVRGIPTESTIKEQMVALGSTKLVLLIMLPRLTRKGKVGGR